MSVSLELFRPLREQWRNSGRLRYLLGLIVAVLLIEGGLRWGDALERQHAELAQLQIDLARIKAKSRAPQALAKAALETRRLDEQLRERLWTVSSEAVGQARMKDWLTDIVKRGIADQYAITLANSTDPVKMSASDAPSKSGYRELRAGVSFRFTPGALEAVLADIEGGEPLAYVDSLLVRRAERRVEMNIRVLVRLIPDGAAAAVAVPTSAPGARGV